MTPFAACGRGRSMPRRDPRASLGHHQQSGRLPWHLDLKPRAALGARKASFSMVSTRDFAHDGKSKPSPAEARGCKGLEQALAHLVAHARSVVGHAYQQFIA